MAVFGLGGGVMLIPDTDAAGGGDRFLGLSSWVFRACG